MGKLRKLQIKIKKAELDLTFPKSSNRIDDKAIQKRLLKSEINRRRKEHLKLTDSEVIKGTLA